MPPTQGTTLRAPSVEDVRIVVRESGTELVTDSERRALERAETELNRLQELRDQFSQKAAGEAYRAQSKRFEECVETRTGVAAFPMPSREHIHAEHLQKNAVLEQQQLRVLVEIRPIVARVVGRYTMAANEVAEAVQNTERQLETRFGSLWVHSGTAALVKKTIALVRTNARQDVAWADRSIVAPSSLLRGIYP